MIEYDNATYGGATAGSTTLSWDHTCSGSNRILLVAAMTDSSYKVKSITYGENDLTKITECGYTSWWYLINPPTGSNTITVTYAGTSYGRIGMAVSYKGVNQTNPIDTYVSAFQNNSSFGVDISPSSGSMVADLVFLRRTDKDVNGSPGSGQTEVLDAWIQYLPNLFSSYKLDATYMSYGGAGGYYGWYYGAIAMKPAPETSNAFLSFF